VTPEAVNGAAWPPRARRVAARTAGAYPARGRPHSRRVPRAWPPAQPARVAIDAACPAADSAAPTAPVRTEGAAASAGSPSMATFLLSVLAFILLAGRARAWLTRREVEIDYEREYRAPLTIGVMPNLPPS